jgi:hypothetical protein
VRAGRLQASGLGLRPAAGRIKLPATATTAGLIVLGQVPAIRDLIGIALVIVGVAVHRAGPRAIRQNRACWGGRGHAGEPEPDGLDLRPQPFRARVLHRLERRRIRGYQIRARVGDTRIT